MPDPGFVRGTLLRRGQLARRGAALLLAGLVAVGLGFSGLLIGPVNLVLIVGGLVATYAGTDRLVWAARRRRLDLLFGLASAWLVVLVGAALLAPVLPLGEHEDVAATIADPIFLEPFTYADHPLGTNGAGLDMLARVIYGARASLTISLMAVAIGLVVGSAIGIVAGFYRRRVDTVIGIFTNALLAVPPLILLIVLATVLDPKVRNMAIALSLLTIPTMVRLARANTISYSQREFVLAARALGATKGRIMARELLPNVVPPMLSMAVVVMSALIVAEASLSFLGLGIQPPTPTWGNMILEAEANDTMTEHPFILLVPGTVLFLTVYSVNLLGERAQQRWDPRGAKL
ncbi:ABC transporter permease [Nocardioides sambongensis]|uniref:ABC transporter permease n=1 Tax=Nocardioides sambongensis TaxID=2589074 RepID=UPI001126F68F|nr:ABC transporter permease [Nocardioides sambongensis]